MSIISPILQIWNYSRNYFNENFDTSHLAQVSLFWYFKSVDEQDLGVQFKLRDPQGALSKRVPSCMISVANSEVTVLQPLLTVSEMSPRLPPR